MLNGKSMQLGSGRYYQEQGVIKILGNEISEYGKRAVIFYGDDIVKGKTCRSVEESLDTAGIEYQEVTFDKSGTLAHYKEAADIVKDFKADIAVGIGSGKIIDTAKAASDMAKAGVITVPTSAATCAATALLYAAYNDEGNLEGNGFMAQQAKAVLVDTDYVVLDCPVRLFISGMVDAMAKYPEYTFSNRCFGTDSLTTPSRGAMALAEEEYRFCLKNGVQAAKDFEAGKVTPLVDDMINLNIMLTGLISNMFVSDNTIILAHNFYDGICSQQKPIRQKFLHGELVAMALQMQLYVNGAPMEEIEEFREFLRALNVPVTFDDIDFPKDEAAFDAICDHVYTAANFEDESLRLKIREGLTLMRG